MGNTTSRVLNETERKLEDNGRLYATIEDIWEVNPESYKGSYNKALGMRRHKKPEMYQRLLEYCKQHQSAAEAGQLMQDWLTQTTATSTSFAGVDGENTEAIEVEAKDKEKTKSFVEHGDLTTILGGTNKSRAHLMPEDIECRKFWGKIAEVLSGAELEAGDQGARKLLVDIIKDFRVNLMLFDGNHAGFFDTLKKGILLAIPLLTPKELAEWEHKTPYEVLIVCDSEEAYKLFSRKTEFDHVEWASTEDVKLAETVMTETSKILADSLDAHWDEYYSQQGKSSESRMKQLSHLKDLLRKECEVLVPKTKDISGFKRHFGLTGKVQLMKVKLGMVYQGDFAAYIPDPWLLAFKTTSNWSAFAYPLFLNKRLKLAPACSSDDSESGPHPAVISLSSSHVRGLVQDAKQRQDKKIVGTCVKSLISDDDSVSTLGDESIAGPCLVSDE